MIEISEELRNHFLTDSTKNNLVVDARIKGDGTVDYTNFYTGDVETYSEIMNTRSWNILANRFPETDQFKDYVDMRYFPSRTYFSISFNIFIHSYSSLPEHLSIALYWKCKDGTYAWAPLANAITTSEYLSGPKRFTYVGTTHAGQTDEIEFFNQFNINVPDGESDFVGTLTISDLQVELGSSETDFPRNFNIEFDNEDVTFESLTYKESLCSQDNIKFGLCEASNAEFSVMGDNHILNDSRMRLYIRDEDDPVNMNAIRNLNWYFNTENPSKDPGNTTTLSWYVEANYNRFSLTNAKLIRTDLLPYKDYYQGKYIGIACKLKINSITYNGNAHNIKYFNVRTWAYYDEPHTWGEGVNEMYVSLDDLLSDYVYCYAVVPTQINGYNLTGIEDMYFRFMDEDKNLVRLTDRLDLNFSIKEFGVYIVDEETTQIIPYDPSYNIIINNTLDKQRDEIENRVPLGEFHVTEVKKKIEHLLEEKALTVYNNIIRLEQNAADWYTQYMFGLSFLDYSGNAYQFTRQIYSTLFNFLNKMGLDYRDYYTESLVASYTKAQVLASHLSSKYLFYVTGTTNKFRCAEFTVSTVTSRRYCVSFSYDETIEDIKLYLRDYYDPLWRGILKANVYVEETRSDHSTNRYLVDNGDFFMVSEDCTSFKVYIPCYMQNADGSTVYLQICKDAQITAVTDYIDLENGAIRLLYYDYNTKEIFPCETSITGRDVVRSLLEPCGCFFRLNRKTNIPEFVYCTKGGLYPAENLYPADDLYPRAGTDTMLATGKYMSFERGENEVQSFGRIQIKKGGSTNETEPICQWEYVGDANEINTYIIDDNIFYCAENMVYNNSMTEVSEMLENMWYRISNMGYVANITQALGMPWVECGDRIGILTMVGGAETFVFRRTMKGIQMLTDTYESNGDEYVKAISNYNYGG